MIEACATFGLPLSDFLQLTPGEFAAWMKAKKRADFDKLELELSQTRLIAYWVANSNPYRKKLIPIEKILTLPSEVKKKQTYKPPTKEEVLAILNKKRRGQ